MLEGEYRRVTEEEGDFGSIGVELRGFVCNGRAAVTGYDIPGALNDGEGQSRGRKMSLLCWGLAS